MYNDDMDKKPLVSIIIPVYNTGKSAKKLIKKILGSKYHKIEIIVVDDGSMDDSLEIITQLESNIVKIYGKENGGPSAARNFGIEKASGGYLLFVDSDDDVDETFVDKMMDSALRENTSLAMSGIRYHRLNSGTVEELYTEPFARKDNESLEHYVLRSMLADGRMYPAFNKIFDANVVRGKNIRFDEGMAYGEDTKFVLDYLKKKNGNIRFVLEPLYTYNVGTETSTAAKVVGVWDNWRKCYKNLKKWVGKKAGAKEKILLRLIYLKWRASWLKAKIF